MSRVVAFVLTFATCVQIAAAETRHVEGALDGVAYEIAKPDDWNGDLVVYAHGDQGEGPGRGDVNIPEIDRHITDRGFAWAASGYRAKGYQPDWFLADILALREHFIRTYGMPRRTIVYGQSLGGHVAVLALETRPEIFQAGLTECGAVDGIGLFDWREAYAAAAEYFSGLPLIDTSERVFDTLKFARVFDLVMGTPGHYTREGARFDSVAKHLSGGDLPHRLEGMAKFYNSNINPNVRTYGPSGNVDTRSTHFAIDPGLGVDAATLNRDIRRATPRPGMRSPETKPGFADLTGKIRVPLLTIHETADFRVPFRIEQDYFRRTKAAGTSQLLVQRAQPKSGHCEFVGDMRERAFDDLVSWMETGKRPQGDDVLGDPRELGRRWQP